MKGTVVRWIFCGLLVANIIPVLLYGGTFQSNKPLNEVSRETGQQTIVLLAEVAPEKAHFQKSIEHQSQQGGSASCTVLGPISSHVEIRHLEESLQQLSFSRYWREIDAGVDYWVYLPAQPSTRATNRILQELKSNRIDSSIFAEGPLAGAISLGVYSKSEMALSAQKHFAEIGYPAEIYEMHRHALEYWLLVDKTLSPNHIAITHLGPAYGEIPLERIPSDCKAVASQMHFP